jgi:RND family efflux transporter MFP subunit
MWKNRPLGTLYTGWAERISGGDVMARRTLNEVVRYLQHLTDAQNGSGLSDAELLERYVRQRDEAAFELLLWRHGVLVLNVCRRILNREADAEDAFQATFLAFVRKAPTILRRGSVASWLYKVAYRVALEARARARKTAARERPGTELLTVQSETSSLWDDLRPILDEELHRLPERLRRPFVLCYLEGKTNEEAAREIGCPAGTIYSRLARGRDVLRRRLLRRGVTLSAVALTAALAEHTAEAAPAIPMVRSAVAAARSFAGLPSGGPISPRATTLAQGVLRTMFVTKLKMVALVMFVVSVLAAGGVLSHGLTAAPQPEAKADDLPPKQKKAGKPDAKPFPVHVVKPTPGGLARTAQRPARLIAAQQQNIVPLISGTIKQVGVDIGDRVKKGQTLLVLDAPLLRKELEQAMAAVKMAEAQAEEAEAHVITAEADVKFAEAGLAKAEVLTRNSDAPRAEILAAHATVAAAKADVQAKMGKLAHAKAALKTAKANVEASQVAMDKARIQESFTRITAAFDGVVTRRTAQLGNFVQASDSRLLTPLLTLQRTDQVRVVVEVSDQDAPLVGLGDPVDLTLDALPGVHLTGQKIARFSPILDDSNRMTVEIDVPNPDGPLMPGMHGQITIHFNKRLANAFVVPSSCVFGITSPDTSVRHVYVVRDGTAYLTQVKMTAQDGKNMEIVGGVKASDLIVTDGEKLEGSEPGEVVPVEIKVEIRKGP